MSEKYINEIDIKEIAISESKAIIEHQKAEIVKLRQQVIQLKAKNYELISQLKQQEINEQTGKATTAKLAHSKFMNSLKERYEINSAKWGYDPVSGEIIE